MDRRSYQRHLVRATVDKYAVAILLGAAHIPIRAARGVIVLLSETTTGKPNHSSCVHLLLLSPPISHGLFRQPSRAHREVAEKTGQRVFTRAVMGCPKIDPDTDDVS